MTTRHFSPAMKQSIRRKAKFFGLPENPLVEWLYAALYDNGGYVWSNTLTSFGVCATDELSRRTLNKIVDIGLLRWSTTSTGTKGYYRVLPGPMLRRMDSKGELLTIEPAPVHLVAMEGGAQ